jgi:hypothetical protein
MLSGQSITPLSEADLPDLRRFLISGFRVEEGATCFNANVLHWKYLAKLGNIEGPRSLIARQNGQIVGHIGLCPREWVVRGQDQTRVSTVHFMDWLASPDCPSAGLMLMLRGCRSAETQYAVGGSADGQKMATTIGYEIIGSVGVYSRVLSPAYRLRVPGGGIRKYAGMARDIGRLLSRSRKPPEVATELRRLQQFTDEINPVLETAAKTMAFTRRQPWLLNYYLQYPLGPITGWTIHANQRLIGFALLHVMTTGAIRTGRIVDCFLASEEQALWHSAVWSILRELKSQSVDLVTCHASSPWLKDALQRNAFHLGHTQNLFLRDKKGLLPQSGPFHLSQLEADHAYL